MSAAQKEETKTCRDPCVHPLPRIGRWDTRDTLSGATQAPASAAATASALTGKDNLVRRVH